jgi:hypothetical protein
MQAEAIVVNPCFYKGFFPDEKVIGKVILYFHSSRIIVLNNKKITLVD